MRSWLRSRRAEAREAVLVVMCDRPTARHYGYETSRAAGIGPGRMYPALDSLLADGLIRDGWDHGFNPPRRYYVMADGGSDQVDGGAR